MYRIAVSLLALLLAACGGSGGSDGGSSSRCSPASAALVVAISEGLTMTGGGSVSNAQTVKSGDYEKAYFVSAHLMGGAHLDIDPNADVATWVTDDASGGGSIYAVDALAKEFSDWGDGGQTDARFSMSDDGAAESRACVGG